MQKGCYKERTGPPQVLNNPSFTLKLVTNSFAISNSDEKEDVAFYYRNWDSG